MNVNDFSDPENATPDPEWGLDRLASYLRERLEIAAFFGRKTALQYWLAGNALRLVKRKLKGEGKWTAWCQGEGVPLTAAYECLKIAEKFPSEADIVGLTTVEAKMIAGVIKEKLRPGPKVTDTEPRDEPPVGGEKMTVDGHIAGSDEGTPATPASASPDDWFGRFRRDLEDEVAAIEDTVLYLQDWAGREEHPLSAALLRVLIESELIAVDEDGGREVVRVDDRDLIVALAAAETALDPVFRRLGITAEVAARHLLAMAQEGRAIAA